MDEFTQELKEFTAGLHDGMGGHADYCAELMERAALIIAKLQEDYTAQGLALKAAKAMQQAETERADANERDAERYRHIRTKERMMLETEDGEARMTATFECAEQFDAAVDDAMATNHATIKPLSTKE